MVYTWLGIMVFALAVEAVTTSLISVWFAVGALCSMILCICGVGEVWQVVAFVVISAVLLTVYLTMFRKKFMTKRIKTNVDAVVGSVGLVEETIPVDGRGRVIAGSQSWSAKSSDGSEIAAGEHVEVLAIDGVKLICKKTDKAL